MTPEELARVHPELYHVTTPGAWETIARHGLLPASSLVELFEDTRGEVLTDRRRATEIPLRHERLGAAILNDNMPLNERALASCLDDGLTPADWLKMLNARVFFWADRKGLGRLLGARTNRGRAREVLVFDTLALARAYAERLEICPINSGATVRRPARRGLTTLSPLLSQSYADWRLQRGTRGDRILEIVVRGGVPDIARYFQGFTS